jgi:serine/threonine protein kinase
MKIGTIIGGRYKIIKELGGGAFGQTFLSEDIHLPNHPLCVIKKLKAQHPTVFPTAKRLFQTEAEVLYKLGEHDQIPRLFAHFEENQEFYLAQEFIDGDLFATVINRQQWAETQVIDLLKDILTTLAFVHEHNVIHRDLKPDNLIRRKKDNKIVLIDFGAVKEIMSTAGSMGGRSQQATIIGTPGYMPIEQHRGQPKLSSDIYAVGVIAIQAITGLYPDELAINPNTNEIEWRDRVQVSSKLSEVIDKMVEPDFRQRYQSAGEALQVINKLKNNQGLIFGKKLVTILMTLLLCISMGVVVFTHTFDIKQPTETTFPKKKIPAF